MAGRAANSTSRHSGSESRVNLAPDSPRTGSAAAPVNDPGTPTLHRQRIRPSLFSHNYSIPSSPRRFLSPIVRSNLFSGGRQQPSTNSPLSSNTQAEMRHQSAPETSSPSSSVHVSNRRESNNPSPTSATTPPLSRSFLLGRSRSSQLRDSAIAAAATTTSSPPASPRSRENSSQSVNAAKALARSAQIENDSMVYLDGPQIYTCGQCRTHLTSHDNIISKSFHGRHGRAYLFDQCVNVTVGPPEDRRLITGMHSVCDIFCKRCKSMVGWTYARAYEASQKYKEGKFIIEKINLYLEESDYYDVSHPAGERSDRWRIRSMSWGCSESSTLTTRSSSQDGSESTIVYEYRPTSTSGALSPYLRSRSVSATQNSLVGRGSPQMSPGSQSFPPAPPNL